MGESLIVGPVLMIDNYQKFVQKNVNVIEDID